MKSYSITHRLIATILLLELLAALSISGAALVYERHVRFRSFDVMLRGTRGFIAGRSAGCGRRTGQCDAGRDRSESSEQRMSTRFRMRVAAFWDIRPIGRGPVQTF